MTQVITSTTFKGGTGKTTTAAVLSQAAAYKGYKVLAIDMDPQGNFSYALATRAGNPNANSYNLIMGIGRPDENIVASGTGFDAEGQGLDVIPASIDLATLKSGPGSARRLQKALEPIKDYYDFVFIDTPASGETQYNALQASTGVVIPVRGDVYNTQSIYGISDLIDQFKRSNPALTIHGVILTEIKSRSNISRQLVTNIKDQCEALAIPYLGEVHTSASIIEAAAFMESLYKYSKWRRSTAAIDYMKILELLTFVNP